MRSGATDGRARFPGDFAGVLAGARRNAAGAWNELYAWLAPGVAGYLRMLGARDVDDLTCEVLLAVFRRIDAFDGSEANFRSWVFTVAHQPTDRRAPPRGPPARHGAARTAHERAACEATESTAMQALEVSSIEAVCAQLPPDQRAVVLLRIIAELSVDQVAEVLGKSPGAVKQLQRRGFESAAPTFCPTRRNPMSFFDGNAPEMPEHRPVDDDAIEAALAGNTHGSDLDSLSSFVSAVRSAAEAVPTPSTAMAAVLTAGLSTEKGDLPATAASNVNGPATQEAGLSKWRKAKMKIQGFLAGLGVLGKVALGVGVAAAATTGAGAAGMLPFSVPGVGTPHHRLVVAHATTTTTVKPALKSGGPKPRQAPRQAWNPRGRRTSHRRHDIHDDRRRSPSP